MAGTIIKGSNFCHTTLYEGTGIGQRVGKFIPFTDAVTINKAIIFNRENTSAQDLPGDAPYLSRAMSDGNKQTFTLSYWMKNGRISIASTSQGGTDWKIGNPIWIMSPGGSPRVAGGIQGALVLGLQCLNDAGSHILANYYQYNATDTARWYHHVWNIDTSESSNANKIKIYVNGQLISDVSSSTYSNYDVGTGNLVSNASGSTFYFSNHISQYYYDGYLAEVNYVDGTIYGPEKFGQTDTSTGRWVPKAISSVTYGTNGFRLEFANTAGQTLGHDTSGNGNNFTVNNISAATDITTDTPTQNFSTMGGKGPLNTTVNLSGALTGL